MSFFREREQPRGRMQPAPNADPDGDDDIDATSTPLPSSSLSSIPSVPSAKETKRADEEEDELMSQITSHEVRNIIDLTEKEKKLVAEEPEEPEGEETDTDEGEWGEEEEEDEGKDEKKGGGGGFDDKMREIARLRDNATKRFEEYGMDKLNYDIKDAQDKLKHPKNADEKASLKKKLKSAKARQARLRKNPGKVKADYATRIARLDAREAELIDKEERKKQTAERERIAREKLQKSKEAAEEEEKKKEPAIEETKRKKATKRGPSRDSDDDSTKKKKGEKKRRRKREEKEAKEDEEEENKSLPVPVAHRILSEQDRRAYEEATEADSESAFQHQVKGTSGVIGYIPLSLDAQNTHDKAIYRNQMRAYQCFRLLGVPPLSYGKYSIVDAKPEGLFVVMGTSGKWKEFGPEGESRLRVLLCCPKYIDGDSPPPIEAVTPWCTPMIVYEAYIGRTKDADSGPKKGRGKGKVSIYPDDLPDDLKILNRDDVAEALNKASNPEKFENVTVVRFDRGHEKGILQEAKHLVTDKINDYDGLENPYLDRLKNVWRLIWIHLILLRELKQKKEGDNARPHVASWILNTPCADRFLMRCYWPNSCESLMSEFPTISQSSSRPDDSAKRTLYSILHSQWIYQLPPMSAFTRFDTRDIEDESKDEPDERIDYDATDKELVEYDASLRNYELRRLKIIDRGPIDIAEDAVVIPDISAISTLGQTIARNLYGTAGGFPRESEEDDDDDESAVTMLSRKVLQLEMIIRTLHTRKAIPDDSLMQELYNAVKVVNAHIPDILAYYDKMATADLRVFMNRYIGTDPDEDKKMYKAWRTVDFEIAVIAFHWGRIKGVFDRFIEEHKELLAPATKATTTSDVVPVDEEEDDEEEEAKQEGKEEKHAESRPERTYASPPPRSVSPILSIPDTPPPPPSPPITPLGQSRPVSPIEPLSQLEASIQTRKIENEKERLALKKQRKEARERRIKLKKDLADIKADEAAVAAKSTRKAELLQILASKGSELEEMAFKLTAWGEQNKAAIVKHQTALENVRIARDEYEASQRKFKDAEGGIAETTSIGLDLSKKQIRLKMEQRKATEEYRTLTGRLPPSGGSGGGGGVAGRSRAYSYWDMRDALPDESGDVRMCHVAPAVPVAPARSSMLDMYRQSATNPLATGLVERYQQSRL